MRSILVILIIMGIFSMAMLVSNRTILLSEAKRDKTEADGQNIIVCRYFDGARVIEKWHYRFDRISYESYTCPNSIPRR